MRRWVGVGLGSVTALGMQALFRALASLAGLDASGFLGYAALFVALVLGGYVAGYLVGRFPIFYGALAAVAFIFVTVTIDAVREATLARQIGLAGLPAIDLIQLTLTDVLAMAGASCGGWLAGRLS